LSPILVATSHGTGSPDGRRSIRALVEALRRRLPSTEVLDAFVDVEVPRVGDVVADAAAPCVIVPLLLSPGYHLHHQIADAAALAAGHRVARTLGPDPRLSAIMADRLRAAGADVDDTVVLAAAGSSEAGALASAAQMADLLGTEWGSEVGVGFLGGSGMPLADVIAANRARGRRIAVASYLLADGHFQDLVDAADADVTARPLLDTTMPDPRLVDLVLDRFGAAAADHRQGSERSS
jgi:sirohydrochlorin ferrochelatase